MENVAKFASTNGKIMNFLEAVKWFSHFYNYVNIGFHSSNRTNVRRLHTISSLIISNNFCVRPELK